MSAPGSITAVITADNHLNRYYDRMGPLKLSERRERLRQNFQRAVQHALDEQADLFIQAGDLFDTPDPRNVDRAFVAREFARLRQAGVRVLGMGGNHDTPKQRTEHGGALPQGIYAQLGALELFDSEGVASCTFEANGLRVAVGALPWSPLLGAADDPLSDVVWQPEGDVSLFMFHHSIEGHIYPGANEPIVAYASLDRLIGAQLVIAGHVHQHVARQHGPMVVLVPGATELMTFGEAGTPGFSVARLERGGITTLDHVPVPVQPRRQLTVQTTELAESHEAINAALRRRIEPYCARDGLLRVHLEGPVTRERYQALGLSDLYAFGVAHTFYFDVDTSGLYVQDEFGSRAAGGVRISQQEEICACTDALLSATDDPHERGLLEEARRQILAAYELEGVA